MEATIKTTDRNLFNSLLRFLKSIRVTVVTEDEKPAGAKRKKFDPKDYEGILSPLNLNLAVELLKMKKSWKNNSDKLNY